MDPAGSDWPVLLTSGEAAERLRVSEHTVRRLVRAGELPALRVGAQIRIAERELETWLFAENPVRLPAPGQALGGRGRSGTSNEHPRAKGEVMAATKVVRRSAVSTDGDRRWSEVAWIVERDVPGEPGLIEFHRYSSADEAYADAAADLPTRRWELTDGVTVGERAGWEL